MKLYSAASIANYFIKESGGKLSPLQIIKLVYYAHGFHLALKHDPLIDELIEAWEYGPVIPSLYHALKSYGNTPVKYPIPTDPFFDTEVPIPSDDFVKALLERIQKLYGVLSGPQLSTLTHQPGTPWETSRRKALEEFTFIPRNLGITNSVIEGWFKSEIERNRSDDHGK